MAGSGGEHGPRIVAFTGGTAFNGIVNELMAGFYPLSHIHTFTVTTHLVDVRTRLTSCCFKAPHRQCFTDALQTNKQRVTICLIHGGIFHSLLSPRVSVSRLSERVAAVRWMDGWMDGYDRQRAGTTLTAGFDESRDARAARVRRRGSTAEIVRVLGGPAVGDVRRDACVSATRAPPRPAQ